MRHRAVITALVALLALGWGASSRAARIQDGNLVVTFNADFAPHPLPRRTPAPIDVEVHGKIAIVDGSHPPPLRRLEVALNRNGRLYTRGLPTCAPSDLQSNSTETALDRCRDALVGRGDFRAALNLGREIAASGKILAFNSRRGGRQALALHLFAAVPVRFTLVVPLTIGHRSDGEFGTVLRARIPRLAGDLGSVTEIHLHIGRRYRYGGKRRSYVSAACAAPPGFTEAIFPFARGNFRFQGHRQIAETVIGICRVR